MTDQLIQNARNYLSPFSLDALLYHDPCTDGFAAAFAGWMFHGDKLQYIPVKHHLPPPWESIKDKNVLIVDFSYKRDILMQVKNTAKKLLILDHHKSAEEDLKDFEGAFFDMERSGAMLSWNYFSDSPAPAFIRYIEDRDLWRVPRKYPETEAFITAFFYKVPFQFPRYREFVFPDKVKEYINMGKTLLEYQTNIVNDIAGKSVHRSLQIDDKVYQVALVNSSVFISEIGNAIVNTQPDADFAMIYYFCHEFTGNDYCKVSLRSLPEKTDVSKVAQHFGGGGHACASGFVLKPSDKMMKLFTIK